MCTQVGGLCPEIMVNQLVQTHIPAQYGNLMVLETSAVAPDISPEITALFKSLEVREADGQPHSRKTTSWRRVCRLTSSCWCMMLLLAGHGGRDRRCPS